MRVHSCLSIRQRYNLKAIHNSFYRFYFMYPLFINTSKIQFESNSQPFFATTFTYWCCLSIRQRYNLKAIHNISQSVFSFRLVVYQYVKDTIWKQFTTHHSVYLFLDWLFINTSKIQFESNSQLVWDCLGILGCCLSIRQRYNLKAIHNSVIPL